MQPCSTCPFLRANFGKPSTEALLALQSVDNNFHDWYSTANAKRLWNGLRTAKAPGMLCHSTDAKASSYGGKDAPAGCERECIGALILLTKHLNHLGKSKSIKDYLAETKGTGLTRAAAVYWIEKFIFSRLPQSFDNANNVGLPWPDPVVNNPLC